MSCDERRAAVARAKEALAEYQVRPDGKPAGKVLLIQALARAEAALRECEGQTYDVDLLLLDLTNTVAVQGSHARLSSPLQQVALSGTRFHFNSVPTSGAALLAEDSTGATLARSPSPLPGTSVGQSSLTVLVPDPTILTAAALSALIPPPSTFVIPPVSIISGLTVTPAVTSIVPTLNAGSITIAISGTLTTGPSVFWSGTATFTHTATYTFSPSKSLTNVRSYVDVAASTGRLGVITRTGFIGPLLLLVASPFIEPSVRARIVSTISAALDGVVASALASAMADPRLAPLFGLLAAGTTPIVSLRNISISPKLLIIRPAVSIHT